MPTRTKASFIPPMLLQRAEILPDDRTRWLYELKLDGYRAIAFKTAGNVQLRSRNNKDFNARYPALVRGLGQLPDETVIDGEIVAFDAEGRPSFNELQNYGSAAAPVFYFVFDVMMIAGRDLMAEPLEVRRGLLRDRVLPHLAEPVRESAVLDAPLSDLIASVRAHRLEGLVAKRCDGRYEPGLRSGAWMKMRTNQAQEFVIGGYTIGTKTFDALVFGYYQGKDLVYAARTRNGFTPAIRARLSQRFRELEIPYCPFVNLPEPRGGRWGQGLTKEKMANCRWLKPVLVGEFEFVEWTPDNHLRHSRFIALREDKDAHAVRRE
jgi:bifunctional non-homologous end joining protein LigD